MKNKHFLLALFTLFTFTARAQTYTNIEDQNTQFSNHVKINGRTLLGRFTTAERDALTGVATGTLIYNTTTNAFNYYNGSAWVAAIGLTGATGATGSAGATGATGATGSDSNNTLDEAYDSGGAGAGRSIIVDAGAVVMTGVDGLEIIGSFRTDFNNRSLINDTLNLPGIAIPFTGAGDTVGAGLMMVGYGDGTNLDMSENIALFGYISEASYNLMVSDTDDISVFVMDSLKINSSNNIIITADTNIAVTAKNITITADTNIAVTAKNITITADTNIAVTANKTTLTSDSIFFINNYQLVLSDTLNIIGDLFTATDSLISFKAGNEFYLTADNADNWDIGITGFSSSASCCQSSTTMFALREDIQMDVEVIRVDTTSIQIRSFYGITDSNNNNENSITSDTTQIALKWGLNNGSPASTLATKSLLINSAGIKIGTAANQQIGLYGVTPVVQPTTGISAASFVANSSGIVDNSATWGGYTIGQIVSALKAIGALE